jgi:Mg2+-importing ATPase
VGIDPGRIILGHEIDALDDAALSATADEATVFAKVSPMQKSRIIQALQARGHVVGFLGDGINDAPALRQADIGISVNSAVDIAKESADLILLEKSLMVLEEGVLEGRRTFGNILKYIRMGTSSNFGNMFSVLGASAWLPFLPMQPVQLLVQNLLYDFSQVGIPFDHMDEEYLRKPRRWDVNAIARFMLFLGPVSSIFDYATFALMWYFFGARTPESQSLFQSGWFIEGLLSQTLIVHIIRTRKLPFVESRASAPLTFLTLAVMLAGLVIPVTTFGSTLGLGPMPAAYFGWLVLILISYVALAQMVKNWFAQKFGYY